MKKSEYNLHIKLNTARNALRYLIRLYNIKNLHIPYYICPVIREACLKENCKINFYHIDEKFFPTKIFKDDDFILYPNYFGICSSNVSLLSKKYKNLIIDNAHAFFSSPQGLASFSSLRKFFNVQDGSFLYLKENIERSEKFPQAKNFKIKNFNKNEYNDFVQNEIFLNHEDIKLISKDTLKKYENIDLKIEIQNRRKRFLKIHEKLRSKNKLKIILKKDDVPYVYPFFTDEKNFIEKLNDAFIIRLWNNLPKNFLEYEFYKKIIPIPLDNNKIKIENF